MIIDPASIISDPKYYHKQRCFSKRLVYISGSTIPSRSANSLQTMLMCQAFARLGLIVDLITPIKLWHYWKNRNENCYQYYDVDQDFTITYIPFPSPHLLTSFDTFTFYLGADQFAAWLVHQRKADICYTREMRVAWTTVASQIPTIYECHYPPPTQAKAQKLALAAEQSSMLAVVAISAALRDLLISTGVPAEKIIVAHDGVDLSRYNPTLTRDDARQLLGLPLQKKIAVYAGHLFYWSNKGDGKGTNHIIESAALHPDVLFLIVGGWGEHIDRARNLTSGLENIQFIGFVQNKLVPLYLAAADVLLMPYTWDLPIAGYFSPLKMFEYMASGRPIIASCLPTIQEVLTNGENAILVQPGSTAQLAKGINTVLENPDLAIRLGLQAYQSVLKYTWEKRAEQIIRSVCVNSI
ncbi:MAG: D-inositol-3-phosphate glycosyltransferase [Anaerolineae bacterium]|nr:D-inositol-3-phosphate glycosyltransferase [Anaerolineae bacterium]